jgi:tRNA (mo5U34)-methyltransferase
MFRHLASMLRAVGARLRALVAPVAPEAGWADERIPTPLVDALDAEDLRRLNAMLPWRCFTVDRHGRRFGAPASSTKRATPERIPDPRIALLDRRIGLAGRSVLEVGCFEGIHTIGLAWRGAEVHAVDARIENVVKSIVRTRLFGVAASISRCDVEDPVQCAALPEVDVLFHVGVLYHLADPVSHLRMILAKARRAVLLDTHIVAPALADRRYHVGGETVPFMRYVEGGRDDPFSGMRSEARWLTLETIRSCLQCAGFTEVTVEEVRRERNGERCLLTAVRSVG